MFEETETPGLFSYHPKKTTVTINVLQNVVLKMKDFVINVRGTICWAGKTPVEMTAYKRKQD
ncbi:MAG: hypothetical protein ACI9BD_000745 [Candidatus Marinamargulisbacteria bacterium]|jgi:hypothetical protein